MMDKRDMLNKKECERAEAMNSETKYKPDIKTNLMSGKIEGKKEKCMKLRLYWVE